MVTTRAVHTPGPFVARGERIYRVDGSVTPPIATIHPLDGTRLKLDADASFFARAASSHDALLEAAKAMLARIENITSAEFSKGGDQAERVALYTAIKAASA